MTRMSLSVVVAVLLLAPVTLAAEAIIIDHTSTAVDAVPDDAIAAAAKIRSVMRHCSILQHLGYNRDGGLNLLQEQNARYDRTNMKFLGHGHPGAEAVIDDFLLDDVTSDLPGGFVEHTKDLYDVYGYYLYYGEKWTSGLPDWPRYRDAMLACEKKFPDKRFIWCTISVLGKYHPADEARQKRTAEFNDAVRQYCRENGKILYDLADIMSHDPEGKPFILNGYKLLCPEYTEDKIHVTTPTGKIQLARAYWVLMARLGGWNPKPKK